MPRGLRKFYREWIEALLRKEPHRERAALERTRDLMDHATRDCPITGYESLVSVVALPDIHDRHILAAAVMGRCHVIVSQNFKHFPAAALEPYGIEAQHPDTFISVHLGLAAVRRSQGPIPAQESALQRRGLPQYACRQGLAATAAELEQFAELLSAQALCA